ncbi:MAG: AAA family ATPase [Aeropyrum sp.]|nr:AAA family ATPase [Aeropyrum sp.]MCE4615532.1 AAA family ATPase [Aeropyrum sp.]
MSRRRPPLIVAVTGLPGSGKSIVARAIAEELGVERVVMGDVVRREVERRGLDPTPENVERVAGELRSRLGRGAVAIILSRELDKEKSYVLDGLRSVEEAEVFRREGWRVVVVGVFAPRRARLERILSRGRLGEHAEEALKVRDESNLRLGVGEALALADYMIVNVGSLEDLVYEAKRLARVVSCG